MLSGVKFMCKPHDILVPADLRRKNRRTWRDLGIKGRGALQRARSWRETIRKVGASVAGDLLAAHRESVDACVRSVGGKLMGGYTLKAPKEKRKS